MRTNNATPILRRGDTVIIKGENPEDGVGIVRRVARDGSWADVHWFQPHGAHWIKRQPKASVLEVQ